MEHFLTLTSSLHHHVEHVTLPTALELPSKPPASNSPPVKGASITDNADYVPITGAFTAGEIYSITKQQFHFLLNEEINKKIGSCIFLTVD